MIWSIGSGKAGEADNDQPIFLGAQHQTREFSSDSVLYQGQETREYPDLFSVGNNSLAAISAPRNLSSQVMGALTEGRGAAELSHDETGIGEYVVEEGDTISSIAQQFGISQNTVLWANDLSSNSVIQPGDNLVILPTTGTMHIVKNRDTVSQIARDHKVKEQDIIAFNNLEENGEIFIGDILIVPKGEKPVQQAGTASTASRAASASSLPSSYFISPVPSPYRITQGLHWYNAVDLSTGGCGSPVYAAAGGQVQRAGYDNRAGNYVRILHPNGVVTFYGHLSRITVSAGQNVSQGTTIGYIGHTGHTIPAGPQGCHLHFDVRGARNPFASY